MKSGWIKRTLGEICDEVSGIIKTGPFGSQLHQSDYTKWGIPVVMPKNIIDDKISIDDIAYISEENAARLSHHRMQPGDIVYGRRGDIGRQALITERENGWLCGTGCLRISLGEAVILPVFLHYYLMEPDVIGWIYNQAIGATMPNLNTTILRSVPILYPPLPIQHRIAEILSAYDDLIENNTRRIKALEQVAHDLYREWFVEFRFPGHENLPLVDSGTEYGMIPQGWGVHNVGEILEHYIGGGWGKEEPDKKHTLPAYVIRGTDIPEARYVQVDNCPLRFHDESNLKMRRLQAGDIVFEVSGGSKGQPVGRALWIGDHLLRTFSEDVICASFCKLLRTNQVLVPLIFYLYLLDIYQSGEIEKYQVQSTGIINFKFSHFLEGALVLIPVNDIQTAFSEFVQPLFDEIQVLGKRNNTLREVRDLLLPRLVSGQVDVSQVEVGGISDV